MKKRIVALSAFFVFVVAIFDLCAFKIFDRDFWLHVKSGEIILFTHALIRLEPFAYTRVGLVNISRHEWLSQVVLFLIFHSSGSTGIILFRSLMIASTFGLVLLVDSKRLWPNVLLGLWTAGVNRAEFMDRPQLFSFLLFAAYLWLALKYLEYLPSSVGPRRRILAAFVVLEFLWVNLHGAVCVFGLFVVGAMLLEEVLELSPIPHLIFSRSARDLTITLAAMCCAFLSPPNGVENLTVLRLGLTDRTSTFIQEWFPRKPIVYLTEIGPLWLAAVSTLAWTRRRPVFCGTLLLITGAFSYLAHRHAIFFSLTALAVTFYQLRFNRRYSAILDWLAARRWIYPAVALSSLLGGALFSHAHYHPELVTQDLAGYGTSERARGAFDFISTQRLKGHMFNSYDIGNYLIYRGYPTRPIFMDGRNVNYGYDFLHKALAAGFNPGLWQQLDNQYQFSYAVIDYVGIGLPSVLPYTNHLGKNPQWKLVYCDYDIAVYLKDIPENHSIIHLYGYDFLTPEVLEFGHSALSGPLPPAAQQRLESELARSIAQAPESIKARLVLAMENIGAGRFDDARRIAGEIVVRRPQLAEPYEIIGMALAGQLQWAEAGAALERAIERTSRSPKEINYGYVADIFSRANNTSKADHYRRLAAERGH